MRKKKPMYFNKKNNGRLAKHEAWLNDVEIIPNEGPDFNQEYINALERVEQIKKLDWKANIGGNENE